MDNNTKHIPFAVIVAATSGDEAAIQEILDFYDGYISKLSLRKLYDEYGNVYMVVDSELKGRIQAAVMDMITNFEIIVI
ncbi:helix-turn-helix domain-containing protein [Thomasclavelia cocleata]|uniref:helix-turn-helix domain-containing protein n=1 Tax=Thomasclavelia cocleata TaxID=69824 RepID=UPI00256FB70C|nr:helix-turn-helix domain-containing protein [Thomasclavelia cocleata]